MKKKTIFISGATGFIGSHLVEKLVDQFDVVALIPSSDIGIRKLPKGVWVEYGDLEDFIKIKEILAKVEPTIIIHLAAITPVRFSFENPEIYQKVNYLATVNLVNEAVKIPNLEKFIFASTMEIYGWQTVRKPFKENLTPYPDSPYAVSKLAAERYIQMVSCALGFPAIILRPCNTFGRKNERGYLVEYLITEMLKGKSPYLGSPEAVRDLMYVTDHINGYLCALNFTLPQREEIKKIVREEPTAFTFNIGNGYEFTVKEIALKIKKLIGFGGEIKEGFPKDYPLRPAVAPYLSLDASKAKNLLGWQPKVSLEEGLKMTIEYWKENL